MTAKMECRIRLAEKVPTDQRNELNYVLPMVQAATEWLVEDLKSAMAHEVHEKLWTALKLPIDRLRRKLNKTKGEQAMEESAVAAGMASLVDAVLAVHGEWNLPLDNAPPPLAFPPLASPSRNKTAPEEDKKMFVVRMSINVGDLFRYRGNIHEASYLYKFAVATMPEFGFTWNQLGIMIGILGSPDSLQTLYMYLRAKHCNLPFSRAEGNILRQFEGKADEEATGDDENVVKAYMLAYALRPLDASLVDRLPPLLDTPYRIVPIMAALATHCNDYSSAATNLCDSLQQILEQAHEVLEEKGFNAARAPIVPPPPSTRVAVPPRGHRAIIEGMRVESLTSVEEAVSFLAANLPLTETILSSLRVLPSEELRMLLRDVVEECGGKGTVSRVARDDEGHCVGACIATSNCVLERQLDRLYSYSFKDEGLRVANCFAQTVFNRLDVPFHVEECQLRRPLFIAMLCVEEKQWGKGIGSLLLQATLSAGRDEGCDGAFGLASSLASDRLFSRHLRSAPQAVAFDSWKGEFRDPPIVPRDSKQTKIYLRIGRFC